MGRLIRRRSLQSSRRRGDYVVRESGDVAVLTFLHDRVSHYYEQVLNTKYRSTETWIKRGAEWKMIASQGCEMPPDPPEMASLSPEDLNEYEGIYNAGSSLTVMISRDLGSLVMAATGQKTLRLQSEVRDVFFEPGSPRVTFIFRRDEGGHVIGYVSRSEGRDLVFTRA